MWFHGTNALQRRIDRISGSQVHDLNVSRRDLCEEKLTGSGWKRDDGRREETSGAPPEWKLEDRKDEVVSTAMFQPWIMLSPGVSPEPALEATWIHPKTAALTAYWQSSARPSFCLHFCLRSRLDACDNVVLAGRRTSAG